MPRSKVAVAGAGVIGLSTALLAQEAGYDAAIFSAEPWSSTTSMKAAASFKPHRVPYDDLTHRMLISGWEHFARLVREPGLHGVRMHTHWEAASVQLPMPPYKDVMQDFEVVEAPGLPGGYAFGWRYRTFFIDTSYYMEWLVRRFEAGGGSLNVLPAPLSGLEELAALPGEIVFNCTGLGAKALCNDGNMHALKGQIVVVDPLPDLSWSISADGFYLYPRQRDTVLGGTAELDVDETSVDPGTASLIVQGNLRVMPELQKLSIRRTYAGLRPYREGSIRLETEDVAGKTVVHNYGHGGAGITLSWGSAQMALELIR